MGEKNCPCCGKHCPIEALSCHRGREFFGERGEHREKPADEDEVVILLRRLGHTLHHGHGHGGAKLDCLNEAERAELIVLLKKCLSNLEQN